MAASDAGLPRIGVSETFRKMLWSCQVSNLLKAVKREVDRRNLSASDLCLMSGVSYWRVYHTLAGHSAHRDVVERLAKVLGVREAA